MGTTTYKEEVCNTFGTKLQRAEAECLDVVLCATIFKSLARTAGVEYDVAIDGYLAEFRATTTNTRYISELEEQVIRLMP